MAKRPKNRDLSLIPHERIERRIFLIRGKAVLNALQASLHLDKSGDVFLIGFLHQVLQTLSGDDLLGGLESFENVGRIYVCVLRYLAEQGKQR